MTDLSKNITVIGYPPLLIRHNGVFDYEGLYKMMHSWLINKRYLFHETKYKDKVSTPFGNEIEVDWTAEKKVTEFIKEIVSVRFHLWDAADVEIIKDGKKVKMTKARMEIKITADMKLDYNEKFSGKNASNIVKKLGEFYVDHVMYWDLRLRYINTLEYSLFDFQTKVKKYLNAETSSNAY